MELVRQSYYAVIPANVRYDKRLKQSEKLMYGEVTALTQKDGYCFCGNEYFAGLYEVAPETVSRWLNHLHELGYIKIERTDVRRISICDGISWPEDLTKSSRALTKKSSGLTKRSSAPLDEKIKPLIRNKNIIYIPPITPQRGACKSGEGDGAAAGPPTLYEAEKSDTTDEACEKDQAVGKSKEECLARLCKLYRRGRNNKTESRRSYYAYLAGTKKDRVRGKTYRFNHIQLQLAAERYLAECTGRGLEDDKVQLLSTFLNGRVVDYVEKTAAQYEKLMGEHYGEGWREVRFRYES